MTKKTILLDLDGVLNNYKSGEYIPGFIPPAREDAKFFLKKLSQKYTIKIFTSRKKSQVLSWAVENGIKEFIKEVTNIKEPAWLFIDDRCICFNGKYEKLLNDIESFKTWQNIVKN